MKTIEKITRDGDIQYFEIITSRKELASFLKYLILDGVENNEYIDEDTCTYYQQTDGQLISICAGDTVKRPNIAKIAKLVQDNAATTIVYGNVRIVYNDRYGDWEVDF